MGHSAGILIGSSRDHPGITTGYSLGIHGIPFGPRTNLTLIIIGNFDQAPTSANFIALNKISIEPTIML